MRRKQLEGAELTKFMGQLNDYLGFFEKVDKRIRNEEVTRVAGEAASWCVAPTSNRADGKAPAKLAAAA